jgi:hypothetical protein
VIVWIQSGSTEPIEALLLNSSGPLTGKTDAVAWIRRKSDGLTYDWDDSTFKAFGSCTTPQQTLTEVDATNYPGQYARDWVSPVADEIYEVTVDQPDASNTPQIGEIRVGFWLDHINAPISSRSSHGPADVNSVLSLAHGQGTWKHGGISMLSPQSIKRETFDDDGLRAIQELVLSDGEPFPGAYVDAPISSRSSHSPEDIAIPEPPEPLDPEITAAAVERRIKPPLDAAMTKTRKEVKTLTNRIAGAVADSTKQMASFLAGECADVASLIKSIETLEGSDVQSAALAALTEYAAAQKPDVDAAGDRADTIGAQVIKAIEVTSEAGAAEARAIASKNSDATAGALEATRRAIATDVREVSQRLDTVAQALAAWVLYLEEQEEKANG